MSHPQWNLHISLPYFHLEVYDGDNSIACCKKSILGTRLLRKNINMILMTSKKWAFLPILIKLVALSLVCDSYEILKISSIFRLVILIKRILSDKKRCIHVSAWQHTMNTRHCWLLLNNRNVHWHKLFINYK